MTEEEKDWEYAIGVLHRLITDVDNKLEYGRQKRMEIKENVRKGKMSSGYRAEFLVKNAREVITWMSTIADSFNKRFPHDRFSTQDMIDVLASAQSMLRSKTTKS